MDAPHQASSARFFVPNATHGAQITALPDADRDAALAIASRFIGHEPVASKRDAARAGQNTRAILDRHLQRERAIELRMKLRRVQTPGG